MAGAHIIPVRSENPSRLGLPQNMAKVYRGPDLTEV